MNLSNEEARAFPEHAPRPPRFGRRPMQAGFALVLVLTLMALMVVLLLSLAKFLQTEGRSSATRADLAEARAMAMVGLQKAVGELQTLAGPDQRVTATADILSPTGVGGADADPAKRHWTGVWRTTNYNPAAPDTREFLGWLVSGTDRPTALGNATSAYPAPTTEVPEPTIELVGLGSLGANATQTIRAPLVPVIDADGTTKIGEYAFWVADEGVKAKFNLPRPSASDPSPLRARYDFMTGQRDAVEAFSASAVSEAQSTDPTAAQATIREQLRLIGVPEATLQTHFHDLTLHSTGILSDTKNGGLKRDLTWLFENSDGAVASTLASLDANPSVPGSQISAEWPSDTTRAHWAPSPTWELLRSFYRLKDVSQPVPARKQTATEQGIMPVVASWRLSFLPGIRNVPPNVFFRVNLDMQLVLWNPYNVSISTPAYDVEYASQGFRMFFR
ncbi:MAG: hypothetical protein WEB60_14870, partial [Terrimicrobiaceae bacterium]